MSELWISELLVFLEQDQTTISGCLGISDSIEIGIPNFDLISLAVGEPTQGLTTVRFALSARNGQWQLAFDQLDLSLVFRRELLKAVVPADPADDRARLRFNAGLLIDSNFNIRFTPFSVSLARSYLANSPFIVSATNVGLDFNAASPRVLFDALTYGATRGLVRPRPPASKAVRARRADPPNRLLGRDKC